MRVFLDFNFYPETRWQSLFQAHSDAQANDGCKGAVCDCGGELNEHLTERRMDFRVGRGDKVYILKLNYPK